MHLDLWTQWLISLVRLSNITSFKAKLWAERTFNALQRWEDHRRCIAASNNLHITLSSEPLSMWFIDECSFNVGRKQCFGDLNGLSDYIDCKQFISSCLLSLIAALLEKTVLKKCKLKQIFLAVWAFEAAPLQTLDLLLQGCLSCSFHSEYYDEIICENENSVCMGVSSGGILGNTLRSNYIVCNMLIGHSHSFTVCCLTSKFKVVTHESCCLDPMELRPPLLWLFSCFTFQIQWWLPHEGLIKSAPEKGDGSQRWGTHAVWRTS